MTPRDSAPASPPPPAAVTVLVADVGNSRIKLAALAPDRARGDGGARLPRVAGRADLVARDFDADALARWLDDAAPGAALLLVGSVNVAAAARLGEVVARVAAARDRPLTAARIGPADLPLVVRLAEPE
ncbi:MAG: hypothetical protein KGQ61_13010, partial [Planctomycetes bacterium]|nr:hypothetical protein [Planctomycetota bacterium]